MRALDEWHLTLSLAGNGGQGTTTASVASTAATALVESVSYRIYSVLPGPNPSLSASSPLSPKLLTKQ